MNGPLAGFLVKHTLNYCSHFFVLQFIIITTTKSEVCALESKRIFLVGCNNPLTNWINPKSVTQKSLLASDWVYVFATKWKNEKSFKICKQKEHS